MLSFEFISFEKIEEFLPICRTISITYYNLKLINFTIVEILFVLKEWFGFIG